MGSEQLMAGGGPRYVQMQSEQPTASMSSFFSFHHDAPEPTRIFDELPKASIISVSRPDAGDISPMLLSYTIECQYKQFKWRMLKKASHVFYLHFALKKRAFIEEIHEKQEQVKEWLQNLGIGEHTTVIQDEDGPDDEANPLHHDESSKNRDVPSSAALPIIRPALGRQHSMSDRAKTAMQGYLNHFLSNMDIVNSREVCRFLEVSKLSFSPEYGPKLKEDYVMVKHLPKIAREDDARKCCLCRCFGCCNDNWQKVWAVLKPGFLALLGDPFDTQPMDIIVFDVLPTSDANGDGRVSLAKEIKERNPLRHSFKVTCGNRSIRIRAKNGSKVKDWVAAINDAGLRPPEGWCHPHRFGSFAPPRGLTDDGSKAQWFIDGQAAFEAIAFSIERAKSEIFICGWWLCPELYLRRPFISNASSRLDALLEAKAKEGVQIYILLYKEVALALKINSVYSKRKLLGIHENVRVLRYPDHFSSGVYLWSHHEKLVIVDYHICFIGGLDLCFGRYDTPEHKVGDRPPSVWPGKDYYNPRESEPNSWEDTMKDELDRGKYPRMPWHDVHCALWGPPCRDLARHFVQRWNYAKRNKAPNEQAIPLLMPQHHMVIPHYLWNTRELEVERKSFDNSQESTIQDSFSRGSSFHDIPLLLPQEADGQDSQNEGPKSNGLEPIANPLDQPSKISSGLSFSFRKIKVEPLGPDMPLKGFVDDLDHLDSHGKLSGDGKTHHRVKSSELEWWETQDRGHGGFADESGQVGPCASCRCQVIRSVSQWSAGTSRTEESIHIAYCSLIEKAEHFVYIENQFFISGLSGDDSIRNRVLEALYRRIMRAYREKKTFRVIIVIPLLPGFQGGLDDSGAASVRAIMHWQYRTICRGQNSIFHNLYDLLGSKVHDYISFYGLRSYGKLFDGGPVATSQVYVHSKIMIVDDCIALIGSANINDRSLLGSRDSEIAIVIEDKELINSYMGGQPWKAGKFCWSLRLSLWSEHLGLRPGQINQIVDPVSDSTYKDTWMGTAKTNTTIYQDVFSCLPNDLINSRAGLRQSVAFWKERLGHTTIDLGIAPERLEFYKNGEIERIDPMERLSSVKGHLVSFPLEFLSKEDLRPVFNESRSKHLKSEVLPFKFLVLSMAECLSLQFAHRSLPLWDSASTPTPIRSRFQVRFLSFCIPHSLLCSGSGSGSGSRLVFLSNLRNIYPINASLNRGMSNSIGNKEEPKELRDESDFESVFSNDSYISVCGFGSLLSERSARSTFPELINFRVARLNGFRRLFGNVAPVFFERGIAKPETKEISSLCAEPCEGETIIVTVFEIKKSEIPAFIQREIEFRFLAVLPETLDGKLYDKPAVLCSRSTDEEFFRVRCKGNEDVYFQHYGRHNIDKIWRDDILPCRVYLRHCVLAAKNLGDTAYNNFLDHTFLGDRRTTIREYLATNGSGIMEEEPPESLKFRYGG